MILGLSVSGLASLYRSRELSPVDVRRFYLNRIASLNGTIGAVTFVDPDCHASEASAARWLAGRPLSPIDGVPILVKANIAVRGWPWHAGIAAYRDRMADADAACIARLREAGVIILGLANMHEAAFGATNDNAAFGRACNPWDVGRTPGGSSGGSAAAVSAGFCAAALGTDTLGSVRIPSAYCGIVGVKPEGGRIDGSGVVPLCPDLDEVGVHARSVEDAAALLDVLVGAGRVPAVRPARVLRLIWDSEVEVESAQSDAVCQAVSQAESAGLIVQDLRVPDLDFRHVQRAALLIIERCALAEHGAAMERDPAGFSAALRTMLAWAARQPLARVEAAHQRLAAVAAMLREVCADGTVIVAPTVPQQAFPWSAPVPENQAAFTMLASIARLAAISVPAGLKDGLPLAVQLLGRDVFGLLPMAEYLSTPCGLPMDGERVVMMPDGLDLRVADDVAFLTLDRPAQRNAVTMAMWRALPEVMAGIAADPRAKIVILAGAGGHFAAGADIAEFEAAFSTPDNAAAYGALLRGAMQAVADCPKPVIAQIEGACIGGGCGLALACDIRIATETARLGITPAKLGLAYSLEDTKRLTDAVGLSRARMMLFTGRLLSGSQALQFGLVDQLAPPAELAGTVLALAREIANASQVSVRITKHILALIAQGATRDTDETRALFADAAVGQDLAEGRRAFLEKRKPRFPTR